VTLILTTIDRIKDILSQLEATEAEPEGNDQDLIGELEAMVERGMAEMGAAASASKPPAKAEPAVTQGTLISQTLERPLRPGEVSLDELERAFRETSIEVAPAHAKAAAPAPAAQPQAAAKQAKPEAAKETKAAKAAAKASGDDAPDADRVANQSIRVNVDTLEHLMTMVSELVLTRNQLLEISRRNEDTEFKVPLQRLSNVTAELQEGVMKTRMQPIGNAWQKLPRIVRDLSGELGKQIELEMHGADRCST
jgi:two-component system, chemotaxis family, sensor kinase CheA